ncbi:MAG: HypC/HybG/HupF family hydrogenase formation chaperone [Sutterellaceae bacterium]|nr:HypC/HybG/HupF family hydrogenase formation chaperone [Sutterellaceae bacterium]
MCLAIPAKVISVDDLTAVVEMTGVQKTIDISLTPDVGPDDWVIVHVGFSLQKIDAAKAKETLDAMRQVSLA